VTSAHGLAATLESLGARVVRPAHGSRPSVGEIAQGILALGSPEVIVLPNDRDAYLAAGQADSQTPFVDVNIIPTRNAAEGIAAALAFDPDASLDENVARMESEASLLRSFVVIIAARDSVVDGTQIRQGQALALDADRRLLACEDDLERVTMQALSRFDEYELVTFYHGFSVDPETAAELAGRLRQAGLADEVEIIAGGQQHDQLLVAVE
jgi:dihydroxyacetone kinase-like predicted kinase